MGSTVLQDMQDAWGPQMMVVTELCEGGDLARAIKRHRGTKAMGWYIRSAKIALDIACGLAYLHSMGVHPALSLIHWPCTRIIFELHPTWIVHVQSHDFFERWLPC